MTWRVRRILAAFTFIYAALLFRPVLAEVERIEILERSVFAEGKAFGNVGPYERLRGRLYFAVEPGAAENQSITDIRLAPRDAGGRVTFAADFVLLKPLDGARGNGRLLYDVSNRGNLYALSSFNDAVATNLPGTLADAGNGFLMEQGYAILTTGWSWDVTPGNGRLRADLPIATEAGKPVYGRVEGEVSVSVQAYSARHVAQGAVGYEPVSADDPNDVLTVRDSALGPRTPIARSRWHFGYEGGGRTIYDPAIITLEGGFKPGAIYTLTYTARGPRVAGLGLAGIRDALLFFRNERADRIGAPNPLMVQGGNLPTTVLAVGSSQAGRLLQTMVYHGLVADGRGRMAFDGALITVAGAGRGGFNFRFAQAGRHFSPDLDLDFPTDVFPFATSPQTDGVTMQTASALDRANALNAVPKLIYINTATEYWGRSASLTHTTADGGADLEPDKRARLYLVAGGAHFLNPPIDRDGLAHCRDPLDYRPLLRAMLLHLDGWVTLKKEPPPSMVPRLSDGTLGKLAQYVEAFPKIPGLRTPTRMLEPPRLDFGGRFTESGIADVVPPRVGKTYPVLVPLPDSDGLDKGGVRLPDISVPLGTYTGWNPQNASTGAPERLARYDGSFVPFERNESDRTAGGDPRPSIKERYPTREAYTKAYAAATLALAEQELILGSDVNPMIDRAGAFYDRVMSRDPADESCKFLAK
jgi:hypothetical protein